MGFHWYYRWTENIQNQTGTCTLPSFQKMSKFTNWKTERPKGNHTHTHFHKEHHNTNKQITIIKWTPWNETWVTETHKIMYMYTQYKLSIHKNLFRFLFMNICTCNKLSHLAKTFVSPLSNISVSNELSISDFEIFFFLNFYFFFLANLGDAETLMMKAISNFKHLL